MILGLHGKHPLDEKQRATLLMGELRCAACHDGMPDAHMKLAPTLADAGSRLRAELMEEFIANPASTHHGTTMPDMLGAETDQSRKKIAAVITAFFYLSKENSPTHRAAKSIPTMAKKHFIPSAA